MVNDKPFLMLAGELHNSSTSDDTYMTSIWRRLAQLHLNTVISTVSWELVEPQEGKFDFPLVDSQIREDFQIGVVFHTLCCGGG
jgi:beta-galactosidase GanA